MTADEVIIVNRELLLPGEPHVLQSRGLLESACERPRNHWHYENCHDVVRLAAILCLGVGRNHAFLQGNKRSGFGAMLGFLYGNGYTFDMADTGLNGEFIISAIIGKMTDDEFVETIRRAVLRA